MAMGYKRLVILTEQLLDHIESKVYYTRESQETVRGKSLDYSQTICKKAPVRTTVLIENGHKFG